MLFKSRRKAIRHQIQLDLVFKQCFEPGKHKRESFS